MKAAGLGFGLSLVVAAGQSWAAYLIDDFEKAGASSNTLGGSYFTFQDGFSNITPAQGFATAAGHASVRAGSFDYSMKTGVPYPFVGVGATITATAAAFDASAYAGVRFWAHGQGSFRYAVQTSDTVAAGNAFEASFSLNLSWKLIEIPFDSMAQLWAPTGAPSPRKWDILNDSAKVVSYHWIGVGAADTSGHIEVDQLEFYLATEAAPPPPANVILDAPKTNQLGYVPRSKKTTFIATVSANPGQSFQIRAKATGTVVFEGTLANAAIDDTQASGESVLQGDFSQLETEGEYEAVVGSNVSQTFSIDPAVYRDLFRAAGRSFYLIRSRETINDVETTIAHAASHAKDALLRSDPSTQLDLTGGWYNAADFGKYSHMHAIAVAYMMLLHELRPRVDEVAMNIPESGNAIPDILDQARFGLEFLLKMQLADGSIMHKVDSEPNLPYGLLPENDTLARYASSPTSIDTADFIGAALQASRVFEKHDAAFAKKCHDAALLAWGWLEQNPNIASNDPYYVDADPTQERLFALAAMVADSKDAALSARFVSTLASQSLIEVAWLAPAWLSVFDVARLPGIDAAASQAAKAKITALADSLTAKGNASGYRLLLAPNEIWWESLETALHRASALLMAYEMTKNPEHRDAAIGQIDWALGANALDQSFVTSFGEKSVERPYHWIFASMGKVLPGWAVGGPNQYPTGADPLLAAVQARGTPPAKCYVDEAIGGSWASNEGEVTDEAALLFVAGWLFAEGLGPVNPESDAGTEAGSSNAKRIGLTATGGGCACRAAASSRASGAFGAFLALALLIRRRSTRR